MIRIYSAGSGHFYFYLFIFPRSKWYAALSLLAHLVPDQQILRLRFCVSKSNYQYGQQLYHIIYLYGKEWAKPIEHPYID